MEYYRKLVLSAFYALTIFVGWSVYRDCRILRIVQPYFAYAISGLNADMNHTMSGDIRGIGNEHNLKPVIYNPNVVHIVSIVNGTYYGFSLTAVKSLIFLSDCEFKFYILSDDDAVEKFHKEIQSWPEIVQSRIEMFYIKYNCEPWKPILYSRVTKKMDYKICTYLTILQSDIIAERTSKVMYLDSDLLAMDDIGKLWQVFEQFEPQHTMATVRGSRYVRRSHYFKAPGTIFLDNYGINAGLLLMDLDKLRRLSFADALTRCSQVALKRLIPGDDQDLLCIYFTIYSEQHFLLPCSWNYRKTMYQCYDQEFSCPTAERDGIHLFHATYINLITEGDFMYLHQCMGNITFHDLKQTVSCLDSSISRLKAVNRSCKSLANLTLSLENRLSLIRNGIGTSN